jgi:hypothetical protein
MATVTIEVYSGDIDPSSSYISCRTLGGRWVFSDGRPSMAMSAALLPAVAAIIGTRIHKGFGGSCMRCHISGQDARQAIDATGALGVWTNREQCYLDLEIEGKYEPSEDFSRWQH